MKPEYITIDPPTYCNPADKKHEMDAFDMEYSDDEGTSVSSLEESSSYNLIPLKTLMIDELDNASCKKTNKKEGSPKSRSPLKHDARLNTIDSYVHCESKKKNNLIVSNVERIHQEQQSSLSTLFESMRLDQNNDADDDSLIKEEKIEFEIVEYIKENWLRKKGSGKDMFGNKSWKSRWCQLVLAKIPGRDEEVPLLLTSWHFTVPSPSTIIILDTKVAVSIDEKGEDSTPVWKSSTKQLRFDVVDRAKSSLRIFSTSSLEERDSWISAINQAVCNYGLARRNSRLSHVPLPPVIPRPIRITRNVSNLDGLNLVC